MAFWAKTSTTIDHLFWEQRENLNFFPLPAASDDDNMGFLVQCRAMNCNLRLAIISSLFCVSSCINSNNTNFKNLKRPVPFQILLENNIFKSGFRYSLGQSASRFNFLFTSSVQGKEQQYQIASKIIFYCVYHMQGFQIC